MKRCATSGTGGRSRWTRHVVGLIEVGGGLASLATLAGFAGGMWWALDLASHFRVQYGLCLAAAAIVLGALRRFRMAAAFGVVAGINGLLVGPLYVGAGHADVQAAPSSEVTRLLLVNVRTSNARYDLVLDLVDDVDPDVVVLLEVDEQWVEALAPMRERLPHAISEPREDNFGMALFSRVPIRGGRVVALGGTGLPSIVADLGGAESSFTLIATHPPPPRWSEGSARRNDQLRAVGEAARAIDGPVVILGDLNATPWSFHFRRLLHDTGLRNTLRGFGVQATWPTDCRPLRIPIDHCLCSPQFEVVDRHVGPDVGSDHLPLVVDLRLP